MILSIPSIRGSVARRHYDHRGDRPRLSCLFPAFFLSTEPIKPDIMANLPLYFAPEKRGRTAPFLLTCTYRQSQVDACSSTAS